MRILNTMTKNCVQKCTRTERGNRNLEVPGETLSFNMKNFYRSGKKSGRKINIAKLGPPLRHLLIN